MTLSIIIVNYNTSSLLHHCLKEVYSALSFGGLEKKAEIIVVDNASADDSISMVRREFPSAKILSNKENLGFAKANNQGIKKAKGEYLLLLNSDAYLTKESLKGLLETIKKDKKIGVVGGKLLNHDNSLQPSAGFIPHLAKVFFWMSFLDDLPFFSYLLAPYHARDKRFYLKEQKVDWVSGACLMARREVFDRAGLLDEGIFMYGEEVEWCYRVEKAGFKVVLSPSISIFHYQGASSPEGKLAGIEKEFKSILFFYTKHKPAWQLFLVKKLLIFGALLRIILFGIITREQTKAALYAKAIRLAR